MFRQVFYLSYFFCLFLLNNNLTTIENSLDTLNSIYPVGCVIIVEGENTTPTSLGYPGTWTKVGGNNPTYVQISTLINSYNSESNKFTFPSDGMIRTSSNYRQGCYVGVILYNGAGSQIGQFGESSVAANNATSNAANQGMWIPVYKNWSCYVIIGNTTTDSARFYPYGYNEWVWRRTA